MHVVETNELAIIEKTGTSWARMGEMVRVKELELQVRAQDALKLLEVLPNSITDVPAAEATLKKVSALKRQIEADRKAITGKFTPVVKRLMAPEESLDGPMRVYLASIISHKSIDEKKRAERKNKADELARIRQSLITTQVHYDAEFKTLIAEKVGTAFLWALQKGTKPGEEIEDYCERLKFKIKESFFEIEEPVFKDLQYITHEDILPVFYEVWKINKADYVTLFATELEKKFSDYEVAYQNKQQALALAKEEQIRRIREIEEQKQHAEVAATLDAVSTDINVELSVVKALKKCYEVDMPETFDNAMKILSAFMANKQKCLEKVNIKKWFSFDASSAAKALAKMKSDDNAFAPLGITWKEVDKL
jgi:hypothetical protein